MMPRNLHKRVETLFPIEDRKLAKQIRDGILESYLKDEAKVFFDEVITKYPGSKEAKKAAFRSKQLK